MRTKKSRRFALIFFAVKHTVPSRLAVNGKAALRKNHAKPHFYYSYSNLNRTTKKRFIKIKYSKKNYHPAFMSLYQR